MEKEFTTLQKVLGDVAMMPGDFVLDGEICMMDENGNEDFVNQIYLMDWERDFKKSKTMAGWTSTHAMFVFASFSYYYFAKILDISYDVTFFPKNSE